MPLFELVASSLMTLSINDSEKIGDIGYPVSQSRLNVNDSIAISDNISFLFTKNSNGRGKRPQIPGSHIRLFVNNLPKNVIRWEFRYETNENLSMSDEKIEIAID